MSTIHHILAPHTHIYQGFSVQQFLECVDIYSDCNSQVVAYRQYN